MMGEQAWFTRLAMLISPEEMTKDPVFAFDKSLGAVDNVQKVTFTSVCQDGWLPTDGRRMKVLGLGSWILDTAPPKVPNNALDPRFINAPAAMRIEVLDETGAAANVAPGQVELIDMVIAGSLPGGPTVPANVVLQKAGNNWQPPPSDPEATYVDPAGYKAGAALPLQLLGMLMFILLAVRGRRKRVSVKG